MSDETVISFPGCVDERLARHLAVVEAIEANGGHLVVSFELDSIGRTIDGNHNEQRVYRCGQCGERGHSIRSCPELDGLRRRIAGKRFR